MRTVQTVDDLRRAVRGLRADGRRLALVPTMGALHEGHMSLIRAGREHADAVCVTIFVNPTQFGPNEDFGAYPRQMRQDCAMLEGAGVELLFAPAVEEMYPQGFVTTVHVAGLTECLCGADRPHHFDGVATVVTKLLLQAQADVAMFGEKDFQQLLVVKQLVRDLDVPTRIQGCPTWREADGLALSSRNKYLSAEQRRRRARAPPGPAGRRRPFLGGRRRSRPIAPRRRRGWSPKALPRSTTSRSAAPKSWCRYPATTAAPRACSAPPASAPCA